MYRLDREKLYKALINGASEVMKNQQKLNEINVFPVPDGDTGNNLYSLMHTITVNAELKPTIRETLESISTFAIIGARGNSGLIFAQYFYGISQMSGDQREITTNDFVLATQRGFLNAYEAVEEPIEGTILTTMRVFHESLSYGLLEDITFSELLDRAYHKVEEAVIKTTEQLLCLKKASVVDSGAKGFALFIKGFIESIKGEVKPNRAKNSSLASIDLVESDHFHVFTSTELDGRYCTEALLESKEIDRKKLKVELVALGNSLVIASSQNMLRIHIHTNKPSEVFDYLSSENHILSQKVDDMKRQHQMRHNRKYKRVIVTDSIADIPLSLLDEGQVVMLHLELLLGRESYIDKLTISNKQLFQRAKARNLYPTYSQPSLKKLQDMYSKLLNYYEEIIVISVSKELSGSNNAMQLAAKAYGSKVKVIDSKQNSVAQGLIVHQTIEKLRSDISTDLILEELKSECRQTKILVAIESLDNMIASGRLPSIVGRVGKYIGLKPIITLIEGKGAIDQITFSSQNAINKIVKKLEVLHKHKGIDKYAITYVSDEKAAKVLANDLEKVLGCPPIYIVESSSVIAVGAGEGALAVAYLIQGGCDGKLS